MKIKFKVKKPTIQVAGQELRIVEQYKHVGSMCTPSGAMGPEVSWRVDRTRVAYLAVAGHFLWRGDFQLEVQEECGCYALGDTPPLQQ